MTRTADMTSPEIPDAATRALIAQFSETPTAAPSASQEALREERKQDQRMFWFLDILNVCGGRVAAFCADHEGRGMEMDTFNLAADSDFTRVSRNDLSDTATVHLTDKGREHLAMLRAALAQSAAPVKEGE